MEDILGYIAESFNDQLIVLFAKESNRIEGILDTEKNLQMYGMLKDFLKLKKLSDEDIIEFANKLGGKLRDREGMDVIGDYIPLKGGIYMKNRLHLCIVAVIREWHPYRVHKRFEELYPFTDGNGRTGRAIWLWQMVNQHNYDVSLGFLYKWYYQSLSDGV